jgi:hypothetical protein
MDQIIPLLDQISLSQKYLKDNYYELNEYWIKPQLGSPPDSNYIPDPFINTQIDNNIKSIDLNLYKIIQIIKTNNIFDKIIKTNTLLELQSLILINITNISFVFGIPQKLNPQLVHILQMDFNTLETLVKQFVDQFKILFRYKFLELLTDQDITQILHTFFHIKKLYLTYYNKETNET